MAFLGAALAVLTALPARAQFTLTIKPLTNSLGIQTQVDQSTPTAPVTYRVFKIAGLATSPYPPAVGSTVVGDFTGNGDAPLGSGGRMVGSFCFGVIAYDVLNPLPAGFAIAPYTCHSALHDTAAGNNDGILLGDANGTLFGFGQQWNFGYFLDDNATLTMNIYPPGTALVAGVSPGFRVPNGAAVQTTTIVDGLPRGGEGGGGVGSSFKNTELWDERSSSGTTVAKGLYIAAFNLVLSNGTTIYQNTTTIPVDTVRFTAFTTSGITPTVASSNINYSITANSSVRIVIAKPGRQFTIDANGDVQSLDASNTVIDTSTNSVIQVITPTVSFGNNTTVWNGLNSLGVAVSSGVYALGISAKDGSGVRALNLAGNNGPLQGTISVDRTPAQSAPGGAAPNVTAISVGGTNATLAGGSAVGTFSTIGITAGATAGPATTVTLMGPAGPIFGGTVTVAGTAITYTISPTITSTGSYTVTISPFDLSGTVPGAVQVTQFNLVVGVVGGGGVTQTNASFGATLAPGPNPAKTSTKIYFTLPIASSITIDIFTLTGQRVLHQLNSYASGQQFFTWGLVNDAGSTIANGVYVARVTATNALGTVHATKKIRVVR